MKPRVQSRVLCFATVAAALLAFACAVPFAAAQTTAQTQPGCPTSTTTTNQGGATNAASTVTNAANTISNIGSIFGKKKAAQNAGQVANAAGGCNAAVNAAAGAAGNVAAGPAPAAPSANSNSAQPAAALSPSATAQPANSPASPQPQGSSAPFVPPSATPAPFTGPLDPSKLPDISGIHLGMPMADAKVALQKLYPNARIDALNGTPIGPQHQSFTALFRVQGDNKGYNQAGVDFTQPPNAPVVWHVTRITPQPHVARAVLIAALRQKYGKESVALANEAKPATSDKQIIQMFWVLNEQGQPVSPIQLMNGSPFGCASVPTLNVSTGAPGSFYASLTTDNSQIPPGYCGESYVGVVATISDQEIIDNLYLDIVDFPLVERSAHATDAWAKGLNDKAREQNVQKSNQVKPQL